MVDGYHALDLNPSYETLAKVWLNIANQAIPSHATTRVMMQFDEINVGNDYDPILCQYNVPSPGVYLAHFKCQIEDLNAGNYLQSFIYIAGIPRAMHIIYTPANLNDPCSQCTLLRQLVMGETITFHARHNFGANRDIRWGEINTYAIIQKLRD